MLFMVMLLGWVLIFWLSHGPSLTPMAAQLESCRLELKLMLTTCSSRIRMKFSGIYLYQKILFPYSEGFRTSKFLSQFVSVDC